MPSANDIVFQHSYLAFRQQALDLFETTLDAYKGCGMDNDEATMRVMTDYLALVVATLYAYFEMPEEAFIELCRETWAHQRQHRPVDIQ